MRFTQLATCVAVGILCLNSCLSKQKGYTIHGKVNGFTEGETIFLRSCDENMYVDSCVIENDEFVLKGQVNYPKQFYLHSRLGQEKLALTYIYVENTNFEIEGDFENFRICKIKGGNAQQIENKYLSQVAEMIYEADTLSSYLNKNWDKLPDDERKKISLRNRDIFKHTRKIELQFLKDNFNSYPGLDRLAKVPPMLSSDEIKMFYNQLSDELKNTTKGQAIYTRYFNKPIALGEQYEDFEAKYINGETFQFSDLCSKDKFVLLNFTGVHCGWCKQFDKLLAEKYDKIKDKVSVVYFYNNRKEKEWIDHVKRTDYPWLVVSDLKGRESPVVIKYNVTGIPRQFLINKNGTIIKDNSGYRPEFLKELEELQAE
ncbi:thioredoxin-like domain-containing protein [Marinifilum sp.]|uniref:thioredoxin-like domain-containing protein n=1 Tax=Marinifilum sp. TaxID=2033137 RepID=UPI003BACCE19